MFSFLAAHLKTIVLIAVPMLSIAGSYVAAKTIDRRHAAHLVRRDAFLALHLDPSNTDERYLHVATTLAFHITEKTSPEFSACDPDLFVLVWEQDPCGPKEIGLLPGQRPGTFSFAGMDVLTSGGQNWNHMTWGPQPIELASTQGVQALQQHTKKRDQRLRDQEAQEAERAATEATSDAQIERVVRRVLQEQRS